MSDPTPPPPLDPEDRDNLARLVHLAGARVSALEDVGSDIAALTTSVGALADSIDKMATKEEVEAASARQDRKRRVGQILMGVVIALLAIPAFAAIVLVSNSGEATQRAEVQREILVECTTPSPGPKLATSPDDVVHECYERSQAGTAAAVASIGQSTVDAAICARTVATAAEIQVCYEKRIAARSTTTTTR